MNLSEAAQAFLKRCWNNGEIRSIHPAFGEKYLLGSNQYKFTEEVYIELEATGLVKVTRTEKSANITGREGMMLN